MDVKIENHPAKNHDGKPLFKHSRAVRVDGRLVAYINVDQPGRPLTFILTLADELAQEIHAKVEELLWHPVGAVGIPPKGVIAADDEDDDDEQ